MQMHSRRYYKNKEEKNGEEKNEIVGNVELLEKIKRRVNLFV